MYTMKNNSELQLWAQSFQVAGALALLSGNTWRTAVKLQGRLSERSGKGEAEGKKGENGYGGARDFKERGDSCLLVHHRISYDCSVHIWLHAALIKSPRLTHSRLSERPPFICLHLTEIEPSWLCLYEAAQACARSLQTNWHIYIGQHRNTDLGLEAVFPCQNTVATLGQYGLATLCSSCFQISA